MDGVFSSDPSNSFHTARLEFMVEINNEIMRQTYLLVQNKLPKVSCNEWKIGCLKYLLVTLQLFNLFTVSLSAFSAAIEFSLWYVKAASTAF